MGVEPDLSEVVDFWVDGEIWLVTAQGKIQRFIRGQKVDFKLKGWTAGWKEVKKIITDTTASEVLIWDKGSGSVVVFDKESGDYRRKLISEDLGKAVDLVVDEKNKRLMLLVDGKVMVIATL